MRKQQGGTPRGGPKPKPQRNAQGSGSTSHPQSVPRWEAVNDLGESSHPARPRGWDSGERFASPSQGRKSLGVGMATDSGTPRP